MIVYFLMSFDDAKGRRDSMMDEFLQLFHHGLGIGHLNRIKSDHLDKIGV